MGQWVLDDQMQKTVTKIGGTGFADITSLTSSKDSASPGDTVSFNATLKNTGTVKGFLALQFIDDLGVVMKEWSGYMDPGTSKTDSVDIAMPDRTLVITAKGFRWVE